MSSGQAPKRRSASIIESPISEPQGDDRRRTSVGQDVRDKAQAGNCRDSSAAGWPIETQFSWAIKSAAQTARIVVALRRCRLQHPARMRAAVCR